MYPWHRLLYWTVAHVSRIGFCPKDQIWEAVAPVSFNEEELGVEREDKQVESAMAA